MTMPLTPAIALHMGCALAATALGPLVLWSRLGRRLRPGLHRWAGRIWVLLMAVTALSALFIRDFRLPNIAGYTPIHLLVPYTLGGLVLAFVYLQRRQIEGHRKTMQGLYVGACLAAGAFTLLPSRLLGQWLWGALGLL